MNPLSLSIERLATQFEYMSTTGAISATAFVICCNDDETIGSSEVRIVGNGFRGLWILLASFASLLQKKAPG